jgi:PKD repeat protein
MVSGPGSVNFGTPTSNVTTVTGLSNSGTYVFRYTAANPNCSASVDRTVFYAPPITNLSTPPAVTIPCFDSSASINFTYNYGGVTNAADLYRNATVISQPSGANAAATLQSGTVGNDTWNLTHLGKTGSYTIRFEYRNACDAQFRDVTLYASFPNGAANAGSDPVVPCNQNFTTLSGNPPSSGTGTWSQVSGPNTANITASHTPGCPVNGLVTGTYVFRWQISSGSSCVSMSDECVVNVASPTVVAANAGADRTVCNTFPLELSGNTPGITQVGQWIITPAAGTIADGSSPNTTVSGLAANTTYNIVWQIANACDTSRDTAVVITDNNANQIIINAGLDQCKPSGTTSFTLNGSAPGAASPNWIALDGGTINSPNSQSTTVTISGDGSRRFVYELAVPGCDTVTDTLIVQVTPAATTAQAGADQTICMTGTPATMNLTGNIPTQGTPRWVMIDGHGAATIATPIATSTSVSGLLEGVYFFEYRIENGVCPASKDTVRVELGLPPSDAIASTTTPSICNATSGTVTLNAVTPTVGTGMWSVVSGPQGSSAPTITNSNTAAASIDATTLGTGTYVFRYAVTNTAACPSSDSDVTVDISRPASSMSTSTVNLCNVPSIQIAGVPNTNGYWTVTSQPAGSPTVTLLDTVQGISNVTDLVQGTYTFLYTIPAAGLCPQTSASRSYVNGTPAPAADAGPDQNLCPGITTATLTGSAAAVNGANWTRASGPNTGSAGTANSNYADTTINSLAAGVYTFRYTTKGTGSCPSETDDALVVIERKANAGADVSLCGATSAVFSATSPVFYAATWSQLSGPNTATILNPAASNSGFTGLTNGTYTFRYELAGPVGCSSNADTVTLQIDQPITTFYAGADTTDCAGGAVMTLGSASQAGITYQWTPSSGLSSASVAQPTFNPTTEGTYTYTLTGTRGVCKAIDIVSAIVKPRPSAPQFNTLAPICGNATRTATITNVDLLTTYTWSSNLGTGTSKNIVPGSYTITTMRDGCSGDSGTVSMTGLPVPDPAFTVSPGCGNNFTVTTPTAGATYKWDFGTGATPANYTGTTANQGPVYYWPLGSKTGKLVVTATNGCKDSSTQAFTAYCIPPVAAYSTITDIMCIGVNYSFTNTTSVGDGPFTYSWDFGDNTALVTTQNATHSYATAGTYSASLTVTGRGGANTVSKSITVLPRPSTAFTINTNPQGVTNNYFKFTATGPVVNDYKWNFGDNTTGIYSPVAHSYSSAGVYLITLQVTSVEGCVATDTQSVLVLSDSVSSGNGGGLESESLGGLVTRRDYNRLKYSLNKPLDYKKLPLFQAVSTGTAVSKKTAGTQELADMMPATLAPGDVARVSTPSDLTALTIAAEALAVDYVRSDIPKAAVLGIKTYDRAYNHTKSICDRFRGAELLYIDSVNIRGRFFPRFALRQENGIVEHAVAFASSRNTGSNNYNLQSDWVISNYSKDDTVYNFQLWAAHPADAVKLAGDVLDKQDAYRSLSQSKTGVLVPSVYITKGVRHKDTLLLTIRNTGEATTANLSFNVQRSEGSGIEPLELSVPVAAKGDTVVGLAIGDGYEYEGLMKAGNTLTDQVYLADGNWGLDFDGHYTSIKNYNPSNDPGRVYSDDAMPLYRKVDLRTVSSDYVTLYKSIKPGTEPANLTGYNSLKFHAAGTGKATIRITQAGITDWKAQYKTEITLTDTGRDYQIAFEDFASDVLGESFKPKDAKTLGFSLTAADGKETALNIAVSRVEFSKAKATSFRALSNRDMKVSPNPTKGPFTVSFNSEAARELLMTVTDITGRVLWEQPIQANMGSNSVDVRLTQPLASGTILLVNLRNGEVRWELAKLSVQ